MTLRTITLDADDLDRVAAFLARILPDEIDDDDHAALERFADAIDDPKPARITYLRPGEVLARDLAEPLRRKIADLFGKFDDLFPEPTVIGPDGAAHPARSRR
jgi:hypothetical protein